MDLPLHIFPPNGLDRSLHTAVLIGLLIGTFFTETLGWTYAGLVVPGYLATVFFAAPVTAVFIIFESILTYFFVAMLGRWVSRTGVWSTAFGRERFYLFIVGAVFIRLAVEGSAVPLLAERQGLVHSRELYSVGLVLVPLVANAFWNSGLKKAGPRIALVTALTAAVLGLLLRTTNLSVSRFQVLNESLSLEFLESPKAHLILVIGAFLGARGNVLYGWDYNGILVPALLAVAWYEPTKLLTTTVEALFIYFTTRFFVTRPPFSRMLLVGPRRMMFVYIAGFLLKMILGFAAARWAPGLQMIDYFGFGYLLPSLLAVKMWNKEHVGVVIMPTLQVSLTSFLVGNVAGYALVALGAGSGAPLAPGLSGVLSPDQRPPGTPGAPEAAGEPQPLPPPRSTGSAAFSLLLAETVPRPGPIASPEAAAADAEARWIARRVAREVLERGAPTEETRRHADAAGVAALEEEGGPARPWVVIGPRLLDPDHAPSVPRAAFRARASGASPAQDPLGDLAGAAFAGPSWLVVAAPADAGSPLPVVALELAEALDAVGVVLLSRHAAVRKHDEAFVEEIAKHLGEVRLLHVEPRSTDQPPMLNVVGSAVGLPVAAISHTLGEEVELRFRPASELGLVEDAPRVRVPRRVADTVGAQRLGAPAALRWPGRLADELSSRMFALTSVDPGGFRAPRIEELRLFDAVIAPRLLAGSRRGGDPPGGDAARGSGEPSAWERAVLGWLGFRAVRVGGAAGGPPEAWGIVEPAPGDPAAQGEPLPPRRGNPTWIVPVTTGGVRWGDPGGRLFGRRDPSVIRPNSPLMVEIPAPRWQIGAFGAGLAISRAMDADALIVAGALPTADPAGAADVRRREGLRSWFERWHEVWLAHGDALSIQAIEADRSFGRDVVVSFGRELVRAELLPPYARPLLETFKDLELRSTVFDGTRELVPFSAAMDAGMSYAKRFAEGRFAIVYLGSAMRELFEMRRSYVGVAPEDVELQAPSATGEGERLLVRLSRLGVTAAAGDVAERAAWLAACADMPPGARGEPTCPSRRVPSDCDLDGSLAGFRAYAAQRNPFDLKAQLERGRGRCAVEILRDAGSGQPWAIAARPGEALLMPLDAAVVSSATQPVPTLERLRRAVALGASAVRVNRAAALLPAPPAPPAPPTSTTSASGGAP